MENTICVMFYYICTALRATINKQCSKSKTTEVTMFIVIIQSSLLVAGQIHLRWFQNEVMTKFLFISCLMT